MKATAPMSRNVTVTKDQLLVTYKLLSKAMMAQIVQHIPPHELAQVMLDMAAEAMSGIMPNQARQEFATKLASEFVLAVEAHNISYRTTASGVIMPSGVSAKRN